MCFVKGCFYFLFYFFFFYSGGEGWEGTDCLLMCKRARGQVEERVSRKRGHEHPSHAGGEVRRGEGDEERRGEERGEGYEERAYRGEEREVKET